MNVKTNEPRPHNNKNLDINFLAEIKNSEKGFIDLIRRRLGITIHQHQVKELQKTILGACNKFHYHPHDYFELLTSCPANSPLLEYLVIGVTIGETYFFRDKNQMQLLQEEILPQIIAKKREQNNYNLRIWSAGCATGEEIFTIAIMLNELLQDLDRWTINLLGTDINTKSLQAATLGQYKEWSMRSISDYYKNRYFTKQGNVYHLTSQLTKLASFFYLNLNDDTFPSISNGTNAQDLILCRNVLIYFDSERVAVLMKKLGSCLIPGGYLLLGASDPINLSGSNLNGHYRQCSLFSRADLLINTTSLEVPKHEEARPLPTPPSTVTKKPPEKIAAPHSRAASTKKTLLLDEQSINTLLSEGKWQEILNLPEPRENQSPFLLNAKATALANLGKLDQATFMCEKSLSLDQANKNTHFLLAMILLELNRSEEAETALRKTLFLDHTFVFAHFQLGLLHFRNKRPEAGAKCLLNALSIAKNQKPDQPVTGVQGLHYGRLVEILEHEIELNSSTGRNFNEA